MKFKRFTCLFLCSILSLCCTACKKSDKTSTDSSYTSTVTETQVTVVQSTATPSDDTSIVSDTSSAISSINSNTSSVNSVVSRPEVSQPPVNEEPEEIPEEIPEEPEETPEELPEEIPEEKPPTSYEAEDYLTPEDFDFKTITKVDYFCVKSIEGSDIIYAVTDIIADTNEEISIGCKLFSDDPNIKINQKTITIPYEYKKKSNSVKITARHSITKISYDFTIKFEDDWPMIFEDEFEGDEIDYTKWNHRPEWLRDKGYVNYWDKSMTFVDGEGHLVSRAAPGKKTIWDYNTKTSKEVDAYLSGAISGKDLFETTYGYYEISVKLHHQTGMWGAFWLICGDMDDSDPPHDNSAVNGCEIDVFESLYNHGGVAQNLHWDGFRGNTCSAPSNGYVTYIDTYDNEYHTFAVSWTPDDYVFLVDGVVTRRYNRYGVCNQPGYMLITTECGTWAGKWVLEEGEYSDMLVDYVRVYANGNNSN